MPRKSLKSDQPLRALLDASLRPIYAIDAHRRIVYCNTALANWLGLPLARIVGRDVEYHSDDASDTDASADHTGPMTGLCPPPSALAGESDSGTVSNLDSAGRLVHRHAQFVPINGAAIANPRPRKQESTGGLLILLGPADLSPAEVAAELSSEPAPDELHRAIRQFRRAQASRYAVESLLGESSATQKLRAQVAFAANSNANVLIAGRPGAGRAHVARAIHYHVQPPRKLVPIVAAVATDDALRRAFDALAAAGDRPTLLIEHLECLSTSHQEQIVAACRRAPRPARIMATIHADAMAIPDGQPALRDLVSTITIDVPRLVERIDDLPLLGQYFLESANRGSDRQVGALSPAALDLLALYSWPGELDELRRLIAEAHATAATTVILPSDLPAVIHHAAQAAAFPPRRREKIVLDELLAQIESEAIHRALSQAKGNKTEAAGLLGMTRPRLYRRMQQLGLIPPDGEQLPTFKPVVDDKDSQLPDFQEVDAEEQGP